MEIGKNKANLELLMDERERSMILDKKVEKLTNTGGLIGSGVAVVGGLSITGLCAAEFFARPSGGSWNVTVISLLIPGFGSLICYAIGSGIGAIIAKLKYGKHAPQGYDFGKYVMNLCTGD